METTGNMTTRFPFKPAEFGWSIYDYAVTKSGERVVVAHKERGATDLYVSWYLDSEGNAFAGQYSEVRAEVEQTFEWRQGKR